MQSNHLPEIVCCRLWLILLDGSAQGVSAMCVTDGLGKQKFTGSYKHGWGEIFYNSVKRTGMRWRVWKIDDTNQRFFWNHFCDKVPHLTVLLRHKREENYVCVRKREVSQLDKTLKWPQGTIWLCRVPHAMLLMAQCSESRLPYLPMVQFCVTWKTMSIMLNSLLSQ